jgi:DNA-binding response OmpR family regulator
MKDLKKYTVLYAEDETIIRMNITHYLKSYFKCVYAVTNGKEALEEFYNKNPDIVILDIDMPYINGLEVAKEIRDKNNKTLIVIITAYTDTNLLLEAVELNLTQYLVKPITKDKLNSMIEKLSKKLKEEIENIQLKDGYYFQKPTNILYNKESKEIYLTKNELKLILLLLRYKNQFVSTQIIEYHIWEDLAFEVDCKARLKSLLSGLRKKLPPKSIKNNYSLGYRLEVA